MWFNYSEGQALWLLPPQEQLCLWDIRRDNYSRSCGLGDLIALRKKKIPENTEHPRACMHAHTHDALRALVTVIRVLPREACSRLMCLIVGQEKRRARTTWGHTVYVENVTRTATVTRLTVVPLYRGTRMTHMGRDNGNTERREGRAVFQLMWRGCFHWNPELHITVAMWQQLQSNLSVFNIVANDIALYELSLFLSPQS